MNEQSLILAPYVFPVFFVSLWLAVTTVLGAMSGWFHLQRQFPRGEEASLLTLHMRSGRMGFGVNMSSILTLSACPSGLRVGVLRLFGVFQRPFMVPWEQISAEPRTFFFIPSVRLSFGRPEIGSLTIDARLWQRLALASSRPELTSGLPHVSVKRSGYGMLLFWVAITAVAATFFYFTSRAGGAAPGLPIVFCIAFPGTVFGVVALIRFLRQVR